MTDSTVVRGDTETWDIPLVDRDEQPFPLNGCAVWVTVKANPDLTDDDAEYQHRIVVLENGEVDEANSFGMTILDDDPSLGVVVQQLEPSESKALKSGTYTYDVQVMLPDGKIKTPIRGATETVVPDWTRAIVKPGEEST